jgi:uncharacterized protein YeaO (DUF488 family)
MTDSTIIKKERSNIEIHTSYISPTTYSFAVESNFLPIFITNNLNYSDMDIKKYLGSSIHFKHLAPNNQSLRMFNEDIISVENFLRSYACQIAELDFNKVISKIEMLVTASRSRGVVMFGNKYDRTLCHRSMLADILNNSGLLERKITEIIV